MRKKRNLREIIGLIKDMVSQSKALVVSNPRSLPFRVALLKATSHDASSPPSQTHLAAVLSLGLTQRAAAQAVCRRLMATRDACVAVKCLLAVHQMMGAEGFRGELELQRNAGNYSLLKLSRLDRDNRSSLTWELSSWAKWYATYLECLSSTSNSLGFFPNLTANRRENQIEETLVAALTTRDILRETNALADLLEEATRRPETPSPYQNRIVDEVRELVSGDYLAAIRLLSVRLAELKERGLGGRSHLGGDELEASLERLEGCKESLSRLSHRSSVLVMDFWGLVSEMEGLIEKERESKIMVMIPWGPSRQLGLMTRPAGSRWKNFDDPAL